MEHLSCGLFVAWGCMSDMRLLTELSFSSSIGSVDEETDFWLICSLLFDEYWLFFMLENR